MCYLEFGIYRYSQRRSMWQVHGTCYIWQIVSERRKCLQGAPTATRLQLPCLCFSLQHSHQHHDQRQPTTMGATVTKPWPDQPNFRVFYRHSSCWSCWLKTFLALHYSANLSPQPFSDPCLLLRYRHLSLKASFPVYPCSLFSFTDVSLINIWHLMVAPSHGSRTDSLQVFLLCSLVKNIY